MRNGSKFSFFRQKVADLKIATSSSTSMALTKADEFEEVWSPLFNFYR